jgi:CheY-like chemotaxis protein
MKKSNTFLLVDDDTDDAFLFQDVLANISPETRFTLATDGQDALDKLGASDILPDLIFLDLNMPRMDGKELLKILKESERYADIPVIMYSTSSHSKDIEETMMNGAVCFITKPSNVNELEYILTTIVQGYAKDLKGTLLSLSNNSTTFIVC